MSNLDSIQADHHERPMEERSREREVERLALVASRTHNSVIITDSKGRIVWVNEAFARLTGYEPEEVIGFTPGSFLQGPDSDPETIEYMRRKIDAGEAFQSEILNYRKDGSKYWLDIDVQPVRNAAGELVQFIAVEQDITARKEAERRLREQAARLEEQSRMASLRAEVGASLNRDVSIDDILGECCEAILRHTGAAFARVWTLDSAAGELVLRASRGIYTHIDGTHARIPIGSYKIGRIAQTREPELTNSVVGNPQIRDQDWAKREGMVAFAGHPLIHADKVVGVLALFSRSPLSASTAAALKVVSDAVALGIVRHREQDQLRASEARFRTFVERATDAFFLLDESGQIVDVNSAACRGLGYERAALVGSLLTAIDAELTPAAEVRLRERLSAGELVTFDSCYRRYDGSTFAVEVRMQPFSQGGRSMSVALARDISQRKLAENALRSAEERQRAVLEAALDCIITMDRHGCVIEFNRAAELTFGYDRASVFGRQLSELIIPPSHRDAHHAGLQRYLDTGVSHILGERLIGLPALRANGSQFPSELTVVPMEIDGEQVFTAFLRDISREHEADAKQREAIAQTERARQEAVAADRAKTLFLANMSHEFRTPMAAVVGYCEMLLDPKLSIDQRQTVVRSINRNGRHLLALISEVLDLSKLDAGQLELEQLPCWPWRAIEDALSAAEVLADDQKVVLVAKAIGRIPRTIVTDPTRFRQILDNLLSNAVKFTPAQGRVELRVRMTDSPSPELLIEVEDNGIGIAPDVLARLFRPFTQADPSTTRRFGGTGLGLSIVSKLVAAMGGTIDVRSEPGTGSCFAISLPLREADRAELVSVEELTLESTVSLRFERPVPTLTGRVLLVEDNPDARNVVRYFLERAGIDVETAENGQIAVDRASTEEFELILMDMQMPVLDGYTATSRLRTDGYTKPIVALTAHATAGDEEKCLRAGCNAYLTKPVDSERLLAVVSKQLPKRSWTTELTRASRAAIPPMSVDSKHDELVAAYRKDLPWKMAIIAAALEGKDRSKLEFLAHRLKGSAGMYGFQEVSETAGLLEQACREGQEFGLVGELVEELQQSVSKAIGI